MTTFSQLVDEMVQETKRPDLAAEIATYLNQTIRELHFEPSRGNVVHYQSNLKELRLTASSESGFVWALPNPATFQALVAVKFTSQFGRRGTDVWAVERAPNRGIMEVDYYYYRIGNSFVFSGYGGIGSFLDIAYFEYPPRLKYYPIGLGYVERPATYDDETGWAYAAGTLPEDYEAAQEKVSNWLLLRWHDVIAEGVRAKIYKRVSDEVRMRTSYSMYTTLRQGLYTSEVAAMGGAL